ncbi:MAG: BTAD domain-containing putative transcriptional regulator [Pseudomonadota bacterium]
MALTGTQPEMRDRISGRLWPDCSARNARKALNTTLWRLRGRLRDAGTDPDRWIQQDSDTLALADEGGPRVDLARLKLIAEAPHLPVAQDDTPLLQLYAGKFAEGLDAEWIEVERRRLHHQFTGMLRRAAETLSASRRLSEAMSLAEALVHDDPLDEDARRLLLRLQLESGNRGKAAREYSELEAVLWNELGVEPSARTQALIENGGERDRSYRIEEQHGNNQTRPGFRIEGIDQDDELLRKVTELRDIAEKLMHGLSSLEAML